MSADCIFLLIANSHFKKAVLHFESHRLIVVFWLSLNSPRRQGGIRLVSSFTICRSHARSPAGRAHPPNIARRYPHSEDEYWRGLANKRHEITAFNDLWRLKRGHQEIGRVQITSRNVRLGSYRDSDILACFHL